MSPFYDWRSTGNDKCTVCAYEAPCNAERTCERCFGAFTPSQQMYRASLYERREMRADAALMRREAEWARALGMIARRVDDGGWPP